MLRTFAIVYALLLIKLIIVPANSTKPSIKDFSLAINSSSISLGALGLKITPCFSNFSSRFLSKSPENFS